MAIIQLAQAHLRFGNTIILDGAEFELERGDKVALLGRNGQGKSTLLKLIQGQFSLNEGDLFTQNGTTVGYLPQEVPKFEEGKVSEWVGKGIDGWQYWLDYQTAIATEDFDKMDTLGVKLEDLQGWDWESRVNSICSQVGLDPDTEVSTLSGGNKRRVLLAEVLLRNPDVLLLDEPTNHLDIESIQAMEKTLNAFSGALVLVTHDRTFMQKVCDTLIELDRGSIFRYNCRYNDFLKHREERLHSEKMANHHFDKKLAEEEVWIRKGVQARRTRNQGRVKDLLKMREERSQRKEKQGNLKLNVQEATKSGRQVINAKKVDFSYGPDLDPIVTDLNFLLSRGDKVALIGPNGCGKTTLLNLMLGKLEPTAGEVVLGTQIEMVYFDQLREQLDEEKTVAQNVSPYSEMIEFRGATRHIMGYLQDFLFNSDRARSPVKVLSGGEKNRLLLARLFLKPFNLLILDEPTNDLDMESLEILEEMLIDYTGSLILVSHDRRFIDNVAISTLVHEGESNWKEYVGGYEDWLRQRPKPLTAAETKKVKATEIQAEVPKAPTQKKKLSFKEKRELEELPKKIEDAELAIEELQAEMQDPDFYKQSADDVQKATDRLADLESELEGFYDRYEALEG
jgi:ATP-binding cassette subfamily F protein uup